MSPSFTLREGVWEDRELVLDLYRALFAHHGARDATLNLVWTESDECRRYISNRLNHGIVFLAFEGATAIGYLAGAVEDAPTFRNFEKQAELQNMFVRAEYRSQGVGRALVNAFLEWCYARNIKNLRVEVLENNPRAFEFYRELGFEKYVMVLERNENV